MSRLHEFSFPSSERVVVSRRVAMVRDDPLKFVFLLAIAAVPAGIMAAEPALQEYSIPIAACSIVGTLSLLFWWLDCLGQRLIVTDRRTIFRKGVLSKFTNEVLHTHIRNIQIRQSLLQRMTHVGDIGISSAGQSGIEIFVKGIPYPYDVKSAIDEYRYADSMVGGRHPQDANQS